MVDCLPPATTRWLTPALHLRSPGAHSDHAGLRLHPARRLPDHHEAGGLVGLLQGRGAALGPPDPLHHDEVRLLRAHRRGPLPVSERWWSSCMNDAPEIDLTSVLCLQILTFVQRLQNLTPSTLRLQVRGAQAARRLHQERAAGGDVRRRLHRRRVLRHRLPPRRHRGQQAQHGQGLLRRETSQGARLHGHVEGPDGAYHHDRYPHGAAVVHLRRCEGGAARAPAAAALHARVSAAEAGGLSSSSDRVNGALYPVTLVKYSENGVLLLHVVKLDAI